jgi:hypothetical protein
MSVTLSEWMNSPGVAGVGEIGFGKAWGLAGVGFDGNVVLEQGAGFG